MDDRVCKDKFFYDEDEEPIINDCSMAQSPDGNDSGEEWCEVEEGQEGTFWGFCADSADYNKVRAKANELMA